MGFIFRIVLVLILILLNGYFVASEYALVAVRKTRIDELVKKGSKSARSLQNALQHLDNYISATQLGITLASLAVGWIGEPAVARFLEPVLSFLPASAALITSHTLAVIIGFCIITFLHIILGELVPKSIALQRSETVSLIFITPLIIFTKIFKPFIWLLNGAGMIVLKAFGLKSLSDRQLVHSEEEIRMLLSQSASEGQIPSKEVEMVNNVFRLGDTPVKFIMIPRTEVFAFNVATMLKDVLKIVQLHPHSRFPVYENTIDSVVGFVHVKDIFREYLKEGENSRLSQLHITRFIINVPEMKKIDSVLQEMRKKRIHIAVVNDEYGGTLGIVTLEDVIESLVGEIEDEFEETVKDIARQKDGNYIINGHTLLTDIQDKFQLTLKEQGYTTIGGLVYGLLGHEPKIGDKVEIGTLSLYVEKIEGKRIKTLKLHKSPTKDKLIKQK